MCQNVIIYLNTWFLVILLDYATLCHFACLYHKTHICLFVCFCPLKKMPFVPLQCFLQPASDCEKVFSHCLVLWALFLRVLEVIFSVSSLYFSGRNWNILCFTLIKHSPKVFDCHNYTIQSNPRALDLFRNEDYPCRSYTGWINLHFISKIPTWELVKINAQSF